jgi:MoaA/NifB/PqqE/SkfB family radical SAM enzyme
LTTANGPGRNEQVNSQTQDDAARPGDPVADFLKRLPRQNGRQDDDAKLRARARTWAGRQAARGAKVLTGKANLSSRLRAYRRRRWVERAFRDFVATDGDREAMLSRLTATLGVVRGRFEEWSGDDAKGREFAEALLNHCAWLDDGSIRHKDLKLKSYVDVSLQTGLLRIFAEYLSAVRGVKVTADPLAVTALLLDHFPTSRPALLARAEILLEKGEVDAAIDTAQTALRVQAVCTSAQQLLMRAYQAKRDTGSKDEALKVLDYDLTDKFCPMPFTHLSAGWQAEAFLCSCPAWLPFSAGNVLTAEAPDAVWNSEAASEIRRSILDGDFSYCSRTLCYYIAARKLPRKDEITAPGLRGYIDNHSTRAQPPVMVELAYDTTCNLACPSCRTELIVEKADVQDAHTQAVDRVILPLLKTAKLGYLSAGGEAFASKHMRSVLSRLNREEYPQLQLHLITNAQLLTPQRWGAFPHLAKMIGILSVSIDAATAETYENLRRPGKWDVLLNNLEFIAGMRRTGEIRSLGINFVVQKDNFREMPNFVELGARLGADMVWFQRVVNYGSYDEGTIADVDVSSPAHPEHAGLLEILRNPALRDPRINRDAFLYLLPEIVASDERMDYLYRDWSQPYIQ